MAFQHCRLQIVGVIRANDKPDRPIYGSMYTLLGIFESGTFAPQPILYVVASDSLAPDQ